MPTLRPLTRPIVLLWLCVALLVLADPTGAAAKDFMIRAGDDVEGDPNDGVEGAGGGGGEYTIQDEGEALETSGQPKDVIVIVMPNGIVAAFVVFLSTPNMAIRTGSGK